MAEVERFSYLKITNSVGDPTLIPRLPITLSSNHRTVQTPGLLDSGSQINLLPYQMGLDLGAVWKPELAVIRLSGNLARYPACGLAAYARVGKLNSVRLAFAWVQTDEVGLILGQMNFFMEFDICFFRSQQAFEIRPKS